MGACLPQRGCAGIETRPTAWEKIATLPSIYDQPSRAPVVDREVTHTRGSNTGHSDASGYSSYWLFLTATAP